jgi:amino acid adenylation domain-containing protein
VLPLYHINAECVTLVPTLLSGGSVIVPHRFSISQFWDWLDEYRCTWSAVVPTIISQLLDWKDPLEGRRQDAFARIRFLRSSSAPLAPSLHREFLDKFGLLLIQAMGSSEAGNIFSNPLPPGENKIGSPGLSWGFETRIINREGVDVTPGESGEVLIRGEAMMRGYYKDPEGTAAVLDPDGWLHTGDLAYQDEDGYFFVVGRSKELIIKGGVNIAPRQIDDVLESYPAVLEAAAVGIPDRYLGEDLVAFVVLRAGAACDEKELLSFCEGRLGLFKTPTRIYFAADLPKGPSGKVQRLRLRDEATQPAVAKFGSSHSELPILLGNGDVGHDRLPGPSASIEQVIAETWAEVLSQPSVDPDSNFFALGGHSLLAVRCVSRLREKIPVALSLSDFFENATVERQAALVRRRLDSDDRSKGQALVNGSAQPLEQALQNVSSSVTPPTIPPRNRAVPCPLSPSQRRLWFMQQLNPELPVYNEAEAVRLLGDLDAEAMERALNAIVARHEILRTTIQTMDNEPIAVVLENWQLQLKRIDLSALPALERQAELDRVLIQEPAQLYRLDTEPGIRATLLCLGPREHVFILMMHHIICDWSSEGVFWRDLSVLYRSFSRGEPLALPAPTIQHGDYAAWQVQQHAEASFAEDLTFWEENLRGSPQLLELPADRTRPPIPSYRGARQHVFLNATLTQALRGLTQRAERTLFTVFAAALNTLLYRYTGQEDILLGIPIADRDRKELESLMGFLLHTQVLRTELSADMTFRELLARVQKGVLGLYLHRAVPFDQVVRRLRPTRNLSYSPLFQVMINFRDSNELLSFIGLEGLVVEPAFAESGASKFDLTLFVTDCGEEIWLEWEYSTDLFDDARIARMLGHFQTLLESVARDPDQRLGQLPLLTLAERQLLVEWNRTAVAYPEDRLLHELVEEQVERAPNDVAVVFEKQQLTFRELDDSANRVAQYLQNLGVGPNVLVGICVQRSWEMLVGLLGILKAGGAYVPMDPAYPVDRLAFMLEDCQPRVLLTLEKLHTRLPPHHVEVVWLDALFAGTTQGEGRRLNRDGRQPTDLAYVLYTSGSSGKPKGVRVSNRALVNFLSAMQREPGLHRDDTLVAVTTLSFDIAALEMFLPLICGARVVIASAEATADGVQLSALMTSCGATVMQATPATWRLLLDAGWMGSDGLKILCGGEAWPEELAKELLSRCKSLWNMYGPTETTVWSSAARVGPGKPVLIGSPIANTTFDVLDACQELVPVGVPGELYIGGDGVAQGYLNRPELTRERFVSDPFNRKPGARLYRTGDAVRRLSDGMIEFLHRTDQQVKVRGFRIELGEIEAVLKQHPGISQCVAVAREDSGGDKRLEAYIVPSGSASALRTVDLRDFVRQKLPEYMVPAVFAFLDSFPLTPNGKIDRKALMTAKCAVPEGLMHSSAIPQTLLELQLLKIWERVLDVGTIGTQDNFFDLGGHSLQSVRLISEINKSLGVNLTTQVFFMNPTIQAIGKVILQGSYARPGPHLIPLRRSESPGAIFFIDASMTMCRLAQLLDVGPAIFATQVPLSSATYQAAVLQKTSALPGMEDQAAAHVALICSHQLSGPCLLVGFSFGGLLAFEVAHQLRRQGRDVKMILVLDSLFMVPPVWYRLKLLSWARARLALARRLRKLWLKTVRLKERTFLVSRSQSALDSADAQAAPTMVDVPFAILKKIYDNALDSYQMRPLDSRGVLILAQDQHDVEGRLRQTLPNIKKVRRLFTRGLDIVKTPGEHLTLLEDPNISALAQRINECIEGVVTNKVGEDRVDVSGILNPSARRNDSTPDEAVGAARR